MNQTTPFIEVRDLAIGYGQRRVQESLNFSVNRNDIFFVIGGSGCGKTTLLKSMIGLLPPMTGSIFYGATDYYAANHETQLALMQNWGITFQTGALFSSMTLAENVALPLQLYTDYNTTQITEAVDYKLALVGLAGYQSYYPSELSGGMQKRAGLARAIALDPELLFFDEPSAGLDPISSLRLDQLIVEICQALNSTVIIVSHELPSILSIGTNGIFLDNQTHTLLDAGPPKHMAAHSEHPRVQQFLNRDKP